MMPVQYGYDYWYETMPIPPLLHLALCLSQLCSVATRTSIMHMPNMLTGIGAMPIPHANCATGTSASTHSSTLRLYQLWSMLTGTGNVRAICNYANLYRHYASFSPLCQLPTYRTRTIPKKAYRTRVPYFLAKIEAYRTVFTYRTVILAFNYSQL